MNKRTLFNYNCLLSILMLINLMFCSAFGLRHNGAGVMQQEREQQQHLQSEENANSEVRESNGNQGLNTLPTWGQENQKRRPRGVEKQENVQENDPKFQKEWSEFTNDDTSIGPMVGGYKEVSLEQDLKEDQQGIRQFVEQIKKDELKDAQLVKYQEQVVAGLNTKLTYAKNQTTKNQDGIQTLKKYRYVAVVYSVPWQNSKQLTEFLAKSHTITESGNEVRSRTQIRQNTDNSTWKYESIQVLFNGKKDDTDK